VLLPRRMSTLQSRLRVLADTFASGVLEAIRGASLEELVSAPANGRAEGRNGPAGRPAPGAAASPRQSPSSKSAKKAGRLPRRSPEDIAKVLAQVVALVKSEKQGLRAEEIRAKLGVQRKEMPRVLKEGIARKQLKAKGQKRSTTYSAP
jgi:DNA invertase Pin-like site-specific DNA recombinase